MRLWSLHPRYLDTKGFVALWREALLARAVLRGETRGYKRHPQLVRFRAHRAPLSAINAYLAVIHAEASERGYSFDRAKFGPVRDKSGIEVTDGQLLYEWTHLMNKLSRRNLALHRRWHNVRTPDIHPLFEICGGPVEEWERLRAND